MREDFLAYVRWCDEEGLKTNAYSNFNYYYHNIYKQQKVV